MSEYADELEKENVNLQSQLAAAEERCMGLEESLYLHEEKDRIANANIVALIHENSRLQAEVERLKGLLAEIEDKIPELPSNEMWSIFMEIAQIAARRKEKP